MLEHDASSLLGRKARSVTPCASGGNSRVYRVEDESGKCYALKSYPSLEFDPRDRLGAEYAALEFLSRDPRICVPRPVAVDRNRLLALYHWVEGTRPPVSEAVIDAMLDFMCVAYELRTLPEAKGLPLASECCLSGAEILRQVRRRLDRLKMQENETLLQKFLVHAFEPILNGVALDDMVLMSALRCLNPGDFGAHNMLVADGAPAFIDMEYFGWDDPVKQVCDVLWHPAMELTDGLVSRFLNGAVELYGSEDPSFSDRVHRFFLAYGLRWVMILLNEFLPERWAMRVHAGATDVEEAKARQLDKAEALINVLDKRQSLIDDVLRRSQK